MKKFLSVIALTVLASTSALADYDEFDCLTNPQLELSGLQCISCGITKYYADKEEEVNPSHKWLVLLGMKVRENNYAPAKDQKEFQKQVIRQIQAYGFCKEYLGKDTKKAGRSKPYHDMSAEDWRYFNNFINRKEIPSQEDYQKAAAKLGFKSGWFSDKKAKENMDYLFEGMYEGHTLPDKRSLFKEKLKEALTPEYNVSGEQNSTSRQIVPYNDDDQGLRNCLEDIKKNFFEKELSDKETYKMCEVVANSCDLKRVRYDKDKDFCLQGGMAVVPAGARPVTQPRPTGQGQRPQSGTK